MNNKVKKKERINTSVYALRNSKTMYYKFKLNLCSEWNNSKIVQYVMLSYDNNNSHIYL